MDRVESSVSAPELHGGLCGALCAGGLDAGERWLDGCLDGCEPKLAEIEDLGSLLTQVRSDSWNALSGPEFEFVPLLPDEAASLALRVDAIASWCHGFLTGLALAGFKPDDVPPDDRDGLMEIIRDFSEISKAVAEDPEDSEERSAVALMELTEFVRIGVQLIFEHLSSPAPMPIPKIVH